jgi:hypothetical protein
MYRIFGRVITSEISSGSVNIDLNGGIASRVNDLSGFKSRHRDGISGKRGGCTRSGLNEVASGGNHSQY